MRKHLCLLTIAISFIALSNTSAQVRTFSMRDTTVQECKGRFTDSNNGIGAAYNHNENLTFTICVPTATAIRLSFSSFCTEPLLDYVRFFNGTDTNAAQIGPSYSGSSLPPTIAASGSYLTINFISDGSVTCSGWEATWEADVPPLQSPLIDTVMATCNSSIFQFRLNRKIPCDSAYLSAFSIFGMNSPFRLVSPISCFGDSTDFFQLTMNNPFEDCGPFIFRFDYNEKDVCDSIWMFNIIYPISINNCPLQGEILTISDSVCLGSCLDITADGIGGDCNYNYTWQNGLPANAGPHTICPTGDTLIVVDIQDGQSPPNSIRVQKLIRVFQRPSIGRDTTLCESTPPFNLSSSLPGGEWSGAGIIDSLTGLYDARRTAGRDDTVYYNLNGCIDSIIVNITPIYAGPDIAACPGSPPFQMNQIRPLSGGTWSGSQISPMGVFNPANRGVWDVVYSVSGCTDTVIVHVDTVNVLSKDTVCRSASRYYPNFSPPGGTWSGPGLLDTTTGAVHLWRAGWGTKRYYYRVNGCTDTLELYIKRIYAGPNLVRCPYAGLDTLNPSPLGGYWKNTRSYPALIDTMLGIYDPSARSFLNYTDSVIYHLDGCTDTAVIYVRRTVIPIDSIIVCEADSLLSLRFSTTRRSPWNGRYSGPGIVNSSSNGSFDPSVAGPGRHKIYYDANGCVDSFHIRVLPVPRLKDTVVCNSSSPFLLKANPPGGIWTGAGVLDTINGIFDPGLTGIGRHKVYYRVLNGCRDSMFVGVDLKQNSEISGLERYYCYRDTFVQPFTDPPGGILSGPGINGSFFNPKDAGPGTHTLYYSIGSGLCGALDSLVVSVGDPLDLVLSASVDSICYGNATTLKGQGFGGSPSTYNFRWSPGNINGAQWTALPKTSTTFTLNLSDGCSDPVIKKKHIHVFDELSVNISTGPKLCFDTLNFAAVDIPSGKRYSLDWKTDPPQSGDSLFKAGGLYILKITDSLSGCTEDVDVNIPSYPFIGANFSISPNLDCNTTVDTLSMIDLSIGGLTGLWSFGDGNTEPYVPGIYPSHFYADSGQYQVKLYIENEGGCFAAFEQSVCVKDYFTMYLPSAFSPNNDGINDEFTVNAKGMLDIELHIFTRWGGKVYYERGLNPSWDGNSSGDYARAGVYTYLVVYRSKAYPDKREAQSGTVVLIR